MQVVQSFQMEHEIAQCAQIHEFQGPFVFLLLFEALVFAVLSDGLVHSIFVEVHRQFEVVSFWSLWINLHGFECFQRDFPLDGFESSICAIVVKVCVHIYHPVFSQNDKAPLVEKVGVSLDNESVALIPIVWYHVDVCFEEAMPVVG